jgi:hypothetical protein
MGTRAHQLAGDYALIEARPGAVDVAEERFEGAHPLANARRELVPFNRRDDARDEVEWEGPFLTA